MPAVQAERVSVNLAGALRVINKQHQLMMNFIVQMNIFLFVKINILLCLNELAVMHYFNAFTWFYS